MTKSTWLEINAKQILSQMRTMHQNRKRQETEVVPSDTGPKIEVEEELPPLVVKKGQETDEVEPMETDEQNEPEIEPKTEMDTDEQKKPKIEPKPEVSEMEQGEPEEPGEMKILKKDMELLEKEEVELEAKLAELTKPPSEDEPVLYLCCSLRGDKEHIWKRKLHAINNMLSYSIADPGPRSTYNYHIYTRIEVVTVLTLLIREFVDQKI